MEIPYLNGGITKIGTYTVHTVNKITVMVSWISSITFTVTYALHISECKNNICIIINNL